VHEQEGKPKGLVYVAFLLVVSRGAKRVENFGFGVEPLRTDVAIPDGTDVVNPSNALDELFDISEPVVDRSNSRKRLPVNSELDKLPLQIISQS
jgi:hypothetical protein